VVRRVVTEALGTALLLAAVVGSGIMGQRLAGGNVAIALLANTIATGAALVALILALGLFQEPISIRPSLWQMPGKAVWLAACTSLLGRPNRGRFFGCRHRPPDV
jgi:hypothetical protein